MDSAGSAWEVDFARIQGLVDRISHTDDVRAMTVGIKAIEAILERNPHFGQLRGFLDSLNMIREAREVLQARELGIFARSRYSVPKPPPLQHQMEHSATQQQPLKRQGVSTPRPRNSSLSTSSAHLPLSSQPCGQRRRSRIRPLRHYRQPPLSPLPFPGGSGGSTGSEKCHRQNPGPRHCKRLW